MIVDETRTLSKGKSPVRISQIPNSTIPKFLPAKLLVNAIGPSLFYRALCRKPLAFVELYCLRTLRKRFIQPLTLLADIVRKFSTLLTRTFLLSKLSATCDLLGRMTFPVVPDIEVAILTLRQIARNAS